MDLLGSRTNQLTFPFPLVVGNLYFADANIPSRKSLALAAVNQVIEQKARPPSPNLLSPRSVRRQQLLERRNSAKRNRDKLAMVARLINSHVFQVSFLLLHSLQEPSSITVRRSLRANLQFVCHVGVSRSSLCLWRLFLRRMLPSFHLCTIRSPGTFF